MKLTAGIALIGLFLFAAPVVGCQTGEPAKSNKAVALARPQLMHAPAAGELAEWIAAEAKAARAAGGTAVVYVGATWCEPCRYFKQALEQGELDQRLSGLVFLDIDLDAEQDRLSAAGYVTAQIPLFAIPGADGRMTDDWIAGSIKGPGAVDQIVPRLTRLLEPVQ